MIKTELHHILPPRKQSVRRHMMYPTGKGYLTFFFNRSEEVDIEYWDFERAREFIRPLWFSSKFEYIAYSYHSYQQRRYGGENFINRNNIECPMKPAEIPDDLINYYSDHTIEYVDFFLGDAVGKELYVHTYNSKGKPSKIYYTYEEACKYVRNIGFETIEDYTYWEEKSKKPRFESSNHIIVLPGCEREVLARPAFLPIIPNRAYKKDWVCLQEYLGLPYTYKTMHRRKKGGGPLKNKKMFQPSTIISYREAREFVRACKLSSVKEYKQYYRHPVDAPPFVTLSGKTLPPFPDFLPADPLEYYKRCYKVKHTWKSWYDFLGLKYNANHDQELENLMNKATHTYYRSVTRWVAEHKLKDNGYRLFTYVNRKIKNNEWDGWKDTLNRHHNDRKCSFEDAKILLSFKNLQSISQYNRWRKKANSPFFLHVLADDDHLKLVYPDEPNATVSNFLSIDLVDKIDTQAKAKPVLAITIVKEHHILVNVVKQGKFEAFIQYHDKPESYLFDFYDKTIWAQLLHKHCEHSFGGNIYYVRNMGMLYQDLMNNFRRMNLARIYD